MDHLKGMDAVYFCLIDRINRIIGIFLFITPFQITQRKDHDETTSGRQFANGENNAQRISILL